MVVGHEEETLVLVLETDAILERADPVPQVKLPRRPVARQYSSPLHRYLPSASRQQQKNPRPSGTRVTRGTTPVQREPCWLAPSAYPRRLRTAVARIAPC